jgi:hypothetical protein
MFEFRGVFFTTHEESRNLYGVCRIVKELLPNTDFGSIIPLSVNSLGQFRRNMSKMKSGLKTLYGSKLGKLIPVFIIAGLVASASAAVFVNYYGSATATATQNDIALVAGPDSTTCATNAPCINVVTATQDYATISMNLGNDSTHTPQPETYFTNPLNIANHGSNSRSIESIKISGITDTRAADFGNITIFYYTTQTDSPSTGTAIGYFSIVSTTGGSITGLPQTIAASAIQYVEIVGYFGTGAHYGDSISFDLQIQWA